MPLFSAKASSEPSEPKPPHQPALSGGALPRRIYSEKEIEDKIMSLPRELQMKTLGVYQRIGKLEASSALSHLRMAREDIQHLDARATDDEGPADPARFHTVVSFRRPAMEAQSQRLKLEDETELS
uniref:SFM domain-containing protein n=1 Tax=Macrostomum lignano TaxID=282301 RepID=A0A1I8GYM4_9PLAT